MNKKARSKETVSAKTLDEVNLFIGEVGAVDREIAREKMRLEALFERARKESAERLRQSVERRAAVLKAITRYARRHRDEILPEGRKSIELSLGMLGWRFDPWKVVLTGEEDTVITWIEANKMPRFLRNKVELNREQLIEEKPDDIPGVHFEQKERFFVEPREETVLERESSVVSLLRSA